MDKSRFFFCATKAVVHSLVGGVAVAAGSGEGLKCLHGVQQDQSLKPLSARGNTDWH